MKRPVAEVTAPGEVRGLFTRWVGGESGLPTTAGGDEKDEVLDPSQYRLGGDGLASRDGASRGEACFGYAVRWCEGTP